MTCQALQVGALCEKSRLIERYPLSPSRDAHLTSLPLCRSPHTLSAPSYTQNLTPKPLVPSLKPPPQLLPPHHAPPLPSTKSIHQISQGKPVRNHVRMYTSITPPLPLPHSPAANHLRTHQHVYIPTIITQAPVRVHTPAPFDLPCPVRTYPSLSSHTGYPFIATDRPTDRATGGRAVPRPFF